MKLRATLVLEMDARTFTEAADHERRLAELSDTLKATGHYQSITIDVKERRNKTETEAHSGRMRRGKAKASTLTP